MDTVLKSPCIFYHWEIVVIHGNLFDSGFLSPGVVAIQRSHPADHEITAVISHILRRTQDQLEHSVVDKVAWGVAGAAECVCVLCKRVPVPGDAVVCLSLLSPSQTRACPPRKGLHAGKHCYRFVRF